MKDILGWKTVSFNSNGGSSVPSQSLFRGEYLKPPGNPVKSQSIFDGWYIDNGTFLSPWDFDIAPTEDMTLHANWRPYGITLSTSNIVFDTQAVGYAPMSPVTVQVTNISDEPTGPLTISLSGTNAGDFTLSASTMASLALGGTGSFTVVPIDNLTAGTYTAKITVSNGGGISAGINLNFSVKNKYTVTFDINEGSGTAPAAENVIDGSNITLPGDSGFLRTGYTFGGWNTNADGTGTNYSAGSSYTGNSNITLYAKWNINKYTVTFQANGGTPYTSTITDVEHDSKINPPADPTYTGYTLGGWYNQNLTIQWDFAVDTVTDNITLYAKWVQNTAGITIDVEPIVNGDPTSLPNNITISRSGTGNPVTYLVEIQNPSLYDAGSIKWEISCVGIYAAETITVYGSSFTLNAAEIKYNSVDVHVLRLSVKKGGLDYMVNIDFEIVE